MKILITGGNGQLGMSFRKIAPKHPEHDFFFFGSKELDITSPSSIEKAFKESQPDVVVNCAAYTAVDQAEDEPGNAFTVNAEGVKNLVEACEKSGAALIHISTDYVFDGTKDNPYMETDPTNPIGVYGASKLAGEQFVFKSKCKAMIIRTSWVFSEFGNNFVKTMLRLGKERDELNVVSDQFGCPTYAPDLAETCLEMLERLDHWSNRPTVYHFSNEGETTWHVFAQEIMKVAHLNCKINPISTEEYPTKAIRPKYSVLSKEAMFKEFEHSPRNWHLALRDCITKLL